MASTPETRPMSSSWVKGLALPIDLRGWPFGARACASFVVRQLLEDCAGDALGLIWRELPQHHGCNVICCIVRGPKIATGTGDLAPHPMVFFLQLGDGVFQF